MLTQFYFRLPWWCGNKNQPRQQHYWIFSVITLHVVRNAHQGGENRLYNVITYSSWKCPCQHIKMLIMLLISVLIFFALDQQTRQMSIFWQIRVNHIVTYKVCFLRIFDLISEFGGHPKFDPQKCPMHLNFGTI